MSDPFKDPSAGGDKLPYDDVLGSLLLFTVHSVETGITTTFGVKDAVKADVAVLDGVRKGEVFEGALIFPSVLKSALAPHVGSLVIGRLAQGSPKPGQKPPWLLNAANDEDKETGKKYLAHIAQVNSPF